MSTESELAAAEDALYRACVTHDPNRPALLAATEKLRAQYAREVNGRPTRWRPWQAAGRAAGPSAARCLTIRQPWAWAILAGHKTVEYRSWTTHYRGVLLIHAAGRRAAPADAAAFVGLDPAALVYSAVLGAVELVDVEEEGDGFAWLLDSPRPLAVPFPAKGKLGLWTPPAGVQLP